MKRWTALVLVLCLCFVLCGCEALSLAENVQPHFTQAEFKESEQYYRNYYYPVADFSECPKDLFKPNTGYGAEYVNKPLTIIGVIQETMLKDGVKYFVLNTDYGTLYISNALFTLPKLDDGTKVLMYFVYVGKNDNVGGLVGSYIDYRLQQ